jgi:hypothetical protein
MFAKRFKRFFKNFSSFREFFQKIFAGFLEIRKMLDNQNQKIFSKFSFCQKRGVLK